jgi:hypothetical protein
MMSPARSDTSRRPWADDDSEVIVGGDVLVDRVGLDVLVVEVGRLCVEAETAKGVAIATIWLGRGHLEHRQHRVHALRPAAAVLIRLHLEQRRLRQPGQARDRPATGVGLLQLVERAMNDELAKLIDPSLDLEVSGERDPFVTRLNAEEVIADLVGLHSHAGSTFGKER